SAAWRRATSACMRAAVESPWPIASSPWVMACRPRARCRSRRLRRRRSGTRHNARSRLHASVAATMATPSASANTGSVVWTRQPFHDSATSPVCSATHAAPAAASAINSRNRMIRYIEILLRRFGERRHGIRRELTRGGERRVALIGLVEPWLGGGAIAGRKRIQLAPRLGIIIAERRRRDPRDDGAAVAADRIGTLDANQLCGARLQAIDDTG